MNVGVKGGRALRIAINERYANTAREQVCEGFELCAAYGIAVLGKGLEDGDAGLRVIDLRADGLHDGSRVEVLLVGGADADLWPHAYVVGTSIDLFVYVVGDFGACIQGSGANSICLFVDARPFRIKDLGPVATVGNQTTAACL
jgi:hypothetical protein